MRSMVDWWGVSVIGVPFHIGRERGQTAADQAVHGVAAEVHGPADAVRPGPVEAVRDDTSTVVVEVGPIEDAGERDGVAMARGAVVGAVPDAVRRSRPA